MQVLKFMLQLLIWVLVFALDVAATGRSVQHYK